MMFKLNYITRNSTVCVQILKTENIYLSPAVHPPIHLTGLVEDLAEGDAVVKRRGYDALCPESPGAHLVHAEAGSHGVFTGSDPVVGGGGDDDPDPAHTARCAARDLPTDVRHGVRPLCAFTRSKYENHCF